MNFIKILSNESLENFIKISSQIPKKSPRQELIERGVIKPKNFPKK